MAKVIIKREGMPKAITRMVEARHGEPDKTGSHVYLVAEIVQQFKTIKDAVNAYPDAELYGETLDEFLALDDEDE